VDYPTRIKSRIARSLIGWLGMLARVKRGGGAKQIVEIKEIVKIYQRELDHFSNS
jgi:hypothetical protein